MKRALTIAAVLLALGIAGCAFLNEMPTDQIVQCGMAYCSDQPCEPNTMSCDELGSCSCTIQVWPNQPAPQPYYNPPEPEPEPWHHHPEPPPEPEPHHHDRPPHHDRGEAPQPSATVTP